MTQRKLMLPKSLGNFDCKEILCRNNMENYLTALFEVQLNWNKRCSDAADQLRNVDML